MKYSLLVLAVFGATWAAGCSKPNPPLTAGGQPVSHWLDELKKPDPKVRRKAVEKLGHIGTADPAAIPAVTEAVKDKDAAVRKAAVVALLNLGPAARDAEPVLAEAAKSDPDRAVREYSAKALDRVRGTGP